MKRYALPTLLFVCALVCVAMTPAAEAAGCPNEAFRVGPSTLLPECRAYEQVSPVEKGDGGVYPVYVPRASASGEAVEFNSNSGFAGAPSVSLANSYVSRRGGADWQTESVDAPQESREFQLTLPSPASSPDLGETIEMSRIALTPGAIESGTNLYLRDNLTGERSLIVGLPSAAMFSRLTQAQSPVLVVGGSDDWSHVLLSSAYALTPEAPEGVNNLYDYTAGQLHLVNYVPAVGGGEVIAGGASALSTSPSVKDSAIPYGHAISADGSRIFFRVNGSVYMREDDRRTIPISVSERLGEEGVVKSGESPVANVAGTVVYFLSFDALTPDTDCGIGSRCLYGADVETGEIQDLTPNGGASGPGVQAVTGLAEDGSTVYFTSPESLVPGAPSATSGQNINLYVLREGGLQFIAQTAVGEGEGKGPRQAEVSPSGRYLAFATFTPMRGEDESSLLCPSSVFEPHVEGDCRDVYLYDARDELLTCASCDGPGRGDSSLGGQVEKRVSNLNDEYPRAVLDDGAVFFDTPNQLVPQDLNNVMDVYARRGDSTQVISAGSSESPSLFADATPDGRNVFFTTAQPLVRQDVDQNIDVYDARVEGGLGSQWPPSPGRPCEGEGCRGAAPTAPSALGFGSGASGRESCFAPDPGPATRRARHLRRRSINVAHRARKSTGPRAQKLRKRARKLRHQSAAERHRATRLTKRAKNCQEVGR